MSFYCEKKKLNVRGLERACAEVAKRNDILTRGTVIYCCDCEEWAKD